MTTTPDSPQSAEEGGRASLPSRLPEKWIGPAQSLVSALLLGFGLNQRYGYAAGDYDHQVLSPLGMQWARPDWFANDWTVANAPQPHWLFDIITWLGQKAGILALVYFLYFAAALLVFGAATSLLARAWAPRHAWQAVFAVTALSVIGPIYLFGSGAIMWPVALPEVLGGMLLYLVCAAILLRRYRLAAIAGVTLAVVHVQVAVIAVVLLAVVAAVEFRRSRKVELNLVVGASAALVICIAALKLRPVAGNVNDFARICDDIIPYHCNSASWSHKQIAASGAVLCLALLTYFYMRRNDRLLWSAVMLLPAVGLLAGTAMNRYHIPTLGVLAQGTNVYRLAVVFVPFVGWGMVVPLFAKLSSRTRWTLAAAVVVLWFVALRNPGWGMNSNLMASKLHWVLPLLAGLGIGLVALTVPRVGTNARTLQLAGTVVLVLACFFSAYSSIGGIWLRDFEPGMSQRHPDLIAWGEQVQKVVPSGATIVVPPRFEAARMATKRAIVADCKYVPYGGDPGREYLARMADLGGVRQCLGGSSEAYVSLTADQLVAAARKYHADYVALLPAQNDQASGLERLGWTVVVRPPNYPADTDPEKRITVTIWRAPTA